jgi:hypothetical protein
MASLKDTLTLEEAPGKPTLETDDTLHITPVVGKPYKAKVDEIYAGEDTIDRIACKTKQATHVAGRIATNTVRFTRDELCTWYAAGDLIINP